MVFKHPLFWKEWKVAKWWSSLIIAMFFIFFLSVSHSLSLHQEMILGEDVLFPYIHQLDQGGPVLQPIFLRHFNDDFGTLIGLLIPVVVMISIMLFQSERKEGVGLFSGSLPITKKDQFKVKWFVGLVAFTIPFLLAILLTIIMRQINIGWIQQWYISMGLEGFLAHDTVGLVMGILVQSYLFLIAFFSILMLMQSVIANNIAASMIGVIVGVVPWFILEAGGSTLARIFTKSNWHLYRYSDWINLYRFMTPDRGGFELIQFGDKELPIYTVISMDDYMVKLISLLVISLIAVFAGLNFYEKNDASRNGYLLMFPWMRGILIGGVALCSGLLGNNLIGKFIKIKSVPYEVITLAISALAGYIIISKIVLMSEKNGE